MTDTARLRLSLLDLAFVAPGQTVSDALASSTEMAQVADRLGRFERLWFAEHHNMATIASAATSVVLAHIAAHTERIRLGSGGVMLPNHSPLVIAEQFGTLASLYPGRIDLGLGRAPGTDQRTVLALRTTAAAAQRFPADVVELQGWLGDTPPVDGIQAVPGRGTHVPLYILGSSLFGAQLAAQLGLPYAFASHFAPDELKPAVHRYRSEFAPSDQLAEPYVIAAANAIAADSTDEAREIRDQVFVERVRAMASRVAPITEEDLPYALQSPLADQVRHMQRHTIAGDREAVAAGLAEFAEYADADEVMLTNPAPTRDQRRRTLEILATV